MSNTKRFARFWTGSYETDADICMAQDICEDNGYSDDDAARILALPVGGKHDASIVETGAVHYLIRVA